ncbi:MAG: UDP-N-acetylmuramoyl-L-alanine--D-glutamate ligase [Coriobacteriia bacterium]|nr:UDP-N-acetylmuramoyl-L-alanine--D-glutamate ligase [Coriobacteriia bacterium]
MAEHKRVQSVVDPRSARSVCILGRGVTGEAVERYLRSLDNPPRIAVFTDDAQVTGAYDLAIVSPGIPPHNPLVTSARRQATELISEPELAFRLSPQRWIVVTGTNGKTTTTALTEHVFNACGMKARVAGNIGTTCIEAIQSRTDDEYLIAELSSYQLAYSTTIAPDAAVLLNITPDHLSWHGSFDAYRDAKLSLIRRLPPQTPAVIDAVLDETRAALRARRDAGGRVIGLGTKDGLTGDMTKRCGAAEAAYVDPETHMLTCHVCGSCSQLLETSALRIRGTHNHENALATAVVALVLGADPQKVAAGLASFEALEHRIEPCGTVNGISFFNDSKATNPEATIKALDAFEGKSPIVMLGGKDKGTPLEELARTVAANCKAAICYGEAGPRIAQALAVANSQGSQDGQDSQGSQDSQDGQEPIQAPGFAAAFQAACTKAQPGDIVLLSPACASFDEFDSFEHRGTVFKELVAAQKDTGATSASNTGATKQEGSGEHGS